jgi:dienelactone hydrolase
MPVPYDATFQYTCPEGSFAAVLVGLQVQTPVAELVDMTPALAGKKFNAVVATGHVTGGTITADYIRTAPIAGAGSFDPAFLIGTAGSVRFTSSAYNLNRTVLLESVGREARVGENIQGQLVFRITDYANQTGRFAAA